MTLLSRSSNSSTKNGAVITGTAVLTAVAAATLTALVSTSKGREKLSNVSEKCINILDTVLDTIFGVPDGIEEGEEDADESKATVNSENINDKTSNSSSKTKTLDLDITLNLGADNSLPQKKKIGGPILVCFGTESGTSENWASFTAKRLSNIYDEKILLTSVDRLEIEDIASGSENGFKKVLVFMSTWTQGTPPPQAENFCNQVKEAAYDFRFGSAFLSGVDVGVIGFGEVGWAKKHFCTPAKELHKYFAKLGAGPICELVTVDTQKLEDDSIRGKITAFVDRQIMNVAELQSQNQKKTPVTASEVFSNAVKSKSSKKPKVNDNMNLNDNDSNASTDSTRSPSNGASKNNSPSSSKSLSTPSDSEQKIGCCGGGGNNGNNDDDSGGCGCATNNNDKDLNKDDDNDDVSSVDSDESEDLYTDSDGDYDEEEANAKKIVAMGDSPDDIESFEKCGDMLTERQRKNITKEGYKVVGTHSAVKLCRWTKHHLRGRGGCYKHTFYGIASLSCMEATPSLACANKCVFCWRHHKNPIGKEWQWKMDSPEMIVNGWLEEHAKLVKQLKGIPNVSPERFEQASKIKHCALSLVGEPIMYPGINRVLELLHENEISSFLVTNAQFPEQLKKLGPCTQLYTSIDAATKDELKRVDRPLHQDFWEKFLACIDALRDVKFSRTVFRLTLVRDYNMQSSADYAKLVTRGMPDFIEIKGVTFNGDSKSKEKMTMTNVPWHEEVRFFGLSILEHENLTDHYELACEHKHSLCILIAHKKFKNEYTGGWNTHIDYDKFHHLIRSGEWKNSDSLSYACETPSWAVSGAKEEGFDPKDQRHFRKKRKDITGLADAALEKAENAAAGKKG